MRVIVSVIAASLLSAGAAHGQGVNLHVQKIGKQVITEVVVIKPPPQSTLLPPPLVPPPAQGKVDPRGASVTATVINAWNWRCGGTLFDDDEGRRWRLVSGRPIEGQPKQMSGWRLIPLEGYPAFFTETGRVFARQ
jgi:hypothetical protein